MTYNFSTLSPADFEDLSCDLLGREIGVRFESFGPGPDGGVDGRHASAATKIVLQAKHYLASPFHTLKREMKRERNSINRLTPSRYILATSRSLLPHQKAELAEIIGPALNSEADIFGPEDLNRLLKQWPDIERSHIKLWLSSSAVLDQIVRSASHAFTRIARNEVETKVRLYAPNPSLDDARIILETHHVVIISGAPGVGKTTLAEVLCYAYFAHGWEFIPIRNLDDGFASIDDTKMQIFFFDDFLGKVALDKTALAHKDSEIARFISRVRRLQNARFILTTRAYIFEEARLFSEYLSDEFLQISKYILDVGLYTRRIRARILYNHLLVTETPRPYLLSLISGNDLSKIVDHANYNPRVIQWMTDLTRLRGIEAPDYPRAFLDALDNPDDIWDIAFRTHISEACQALLLTLYFGPEHDVSIDELRVAYAKTRSRLATRYGKPHRTRDFEESLKILEGGFISISGTSVTFVNPSLRDYLRKYLSDLSVLQEFACTCVRSDQARSIWLQGLELSPTKDQLGDLALSFLPIADYIVWQPVEKTVRRRRLETLHPVGLSNTGRIRLLYDWWEASEDERFATLSLSLAASPVNGFSPSLDGRNAIELLSFVWERGKGRDSCWLDELIQRLRESITKMLERQMSAQQLEQITLAANQNEECLNDDIRIALRNAIGIQLRNAQAETARTGSAQLWEDFASISKLAQYGGFPTISITMTCPWPEGENQLVATWSPPETSDHFDDAALRSMFQELIQDQSRL